MIAKKESIRHELNKIYYMVIGKGIPIAILYGFRLVHHYCNK